MKRYLLISEIIGLTILLFISADSYSQNHYLARVVQPNPISTPSLCLVSVSNENNNLIVWGKTSDNFVDYVKIYRESTQQTDKWNSIGTIDANSSLFIDSTTEPLKQSYRYKISMVDKCGNETPLSSSHKTMNLSALRTMNNSYLLIWDKYEGFEVSSYRVYRGITPTDLKMIGSTTEGNYNYNDINAPEGIIYYQIEVLRDNSCNTDKTSTIYNSSRSNIVSNVATQITDLKIDSEILILPNPFNNRTTIKFTNKDDQHFEFNVFDISGKKIKTIDINTGQFDFQRNDLSEGLYLIELKGHNKTLKSKMIISK